jgi:hypothetical protein
MRYLLPLTILIVSGPVMAFIGLMSDDSVFLPVTKFMFSLY